MQRADPLRSVTKEHQEKNPSNCSLGRSRTPTGRRTPHQGRLTPFEPEKVSQYQGLFRLPLFSSYNIVQKLDRDPDPHIAAAWSSFPGTAGFLPEIILQTGRTLSYLGTCRLERG